MTDRSALQGLLAVLDCAVFAENDDGSFSAADRLPYWCEGFLPTPAADRVRLEQCFLFLETFLEEARRFWADPAPGRLNSGPWTEADAAGCERTLHASALMHRDRRLLMINLLGDDFAETQRVLQRARTLALDLERLGRVALALDRAAPGERTLLEASPDTLMLLRPDGGYVELNHGGASRLRRLDELLPPDVCALFTAHIRSAVDGFTPPPIRYELESSQGARHYESRIAPFDDSQALAIVRDITELVRSERELEQRLSKLRRRQEDLALVLDELDVGALFIDEHARITLASDSAARLLAAASDDLSGLDWMDALALKRSERAALESALAAPAGDRPRVRLRRDDVILEADLRPDPRDAARLMVFLYDVSEVETLRRRVEEHAVFEDMIGQSAAMQDVYRLIEDLAPVDSTVLVEGETGSGKELVARALHNRSRRAAGPFVAVNCAGLPESIVASQLFGHKRGAFTGAIQDQRGLFEAAHGGTLFLDEIGDVPPGVQTSLLRVLQDKMVTRLGETTSRKVDCRVVVATHRDLAAEVREGRFRADLLYRIRVGRIHLPALRERREDIPLLAKRFLADLRAEIGKPVAGVSTEAMRTLTGYPWPGNVRELRSALEYAVIRARSERIQPEDLPPELDPPPADQEEAERRRYEDALDRADGNRTRAAELLGVSRATFYRRLSQLGLDAG
ncbi:MAG: sigma 54-interacting transcriptional regulator [Acidobacteria bacterium]|nr:sigma 54-interacting transcriptional regulator [Acidobacteriota bacterium]